MLLIKQTHLAEQHSEKECFLLNRLILQSHTQNIESNLAFPDHKFHFAAQIKNSFYRCWIRFHSENQQGIKTQLFKATQMESSYDFFLTKNAKK